MEKMNKEDLIATYRTVKAEEGEKVSEAQAKRDVDALLVSFMQVFEPHKNAVPDKHNVRARLQLVNFGALELRNVPERKHNNPRDKDAEPIIKPEHNKVVLDIGKAFKEVIN